MVNPGFNNLSYGAFIKPMLPRPPNSDDIIHVSGYPAQHFKLEISEATSPGKASCGVRGSANQTVEVAGGPDLYDGKWHELECRVIHKPSDHLELWVDRVKVASVNGPIGSIVTGSGFCSANIRPWRPAVTAGGWTMSASAGRRRDRRPRRIR